MGKIIIRNEEDVYWHLAAYLANATALREAVLEMREYPPLTIVLRGDKFDGSMTPTVMQAFIEFQRGINRAYAVARFGAPAVQRLTAAERQALELSVRVRRGSSVLQFDMTKILLKLMDSASPMPPEYITATVLGSVALFAGTTVVKHIISKRAEMRRHLEEQKTQRETQVTLREMTAQETQRMNIMAELVRRHPVMENLQRSAEDATVATLKGIASARDGDIQGVHVEAAEAAALAANARRQSAEMRLDGFYYIRVVNSRNPAFFKVALSAADGDAELTAEARDSELSAADKRALQTAEWEHQPVWLAINAKDLDGDISAAKILSVGSKKL